MAVQQRRGHLGIPEEKVEHFKARERCVDFVRKALDAGQHRQLVSLDLNGLR
jgi:hypothetical protein